jgi:hypothetical protein
LWEAVSGHDVATDGHLRIGAKESLKALTRHFSGGAGGRGRGPGGHAWYARSPLMIHVHIREILIFGQCGLDGRARSASDS